MKFKAGDKVRVLHALECDPFTVGETTEVIGNVHYSGFVVVHSSIGPYNMFEKELELVDS